MPSFTSAIPCSTFSRVTQFMRPRWSSGPKSPQLEPGGLCFQRCAIGGLVVMPADPLGDERRLLFAFDLHGRVPRHLHAITFHLFELQKRKACAHSRTDRHG